MPRDYIQLSEDEMCILIKIKGENPDDGSVEFDLYPLVHKDTSALSKDGHDTLTDILKAMCAVATLPPEDLDMLLERYYDNFEDMERKRKEEWLEKYKDEVVVPFPSVTKH